MTLVAIARPDGFEVSRIEDELKGSVPAMSPDRLVYMANQIGKFFESQRADEVSPEYRSYRQVWDPRMRTAIFAYMDSGGEGIDPPVREALLKLKEEAGQKGKPSLGEKSSFRERKGQISAWRHRSSYGMTTSHAGTSASSSATVRAAAIAVRWGRAAGAVADLGYSSPSPWRSLSKWLVRNGRPAAAGLLYVVAGLFYRLPVPVQPLKAFGAIAIAQGLGTDEIAAGALLMGGIFVVLGASGLSTGSLRFSRARSSEACSCRWGHCCQLA